MSIGGSVQLFGHMQVPAWNTTRGKQFLCFVLGKSRKNHSHRPRLIDSNIGSASKKENAVVTTRLRL